MMWWKCTYSVECECCVYLCSFPVYSDQRMDALVDTREQLEQSRVMVHGLQQEVGAPVGDVAVWLVVRTYARKYLHSMVCSDQ